jgi:hypothetical protein
MSVILDESIVDDWLDPRQPLAPLAVASISVVAFYA